LTGPFGVTAQMWLALFPGSLQGRDKTSSYNGKVVLEVEKTGHKETRNRTIRRRRRREEEKKEKCGGGGKKRALPSSKVFRFSLFLSDS
jgi:hypothetical protein